MRGYKLSLDLDGTVANFNKKAGQVLGQSFEGCNNDIAWDRLSKECPTLYRNLELLPDARFLLDFFKNRSLKYSVLTAIPKKAIFPDVTAQKRKWVWENLGRNIHTNFGPFSVDKQFHCLGNHHILIDDNPLCIEQWVSKGGLGIYHTDAQSTIEFLQGLGF